MNSANHQHCCSLEEEAGPSELARADSNANLTNQSQSNSECKGAIPKTKPAVKIKPASVKKSIKHNNNIDEIPILTSAVQNDILEVNGVSLNSYFTSCKKEDSANSISIANNVDHMNEYKIALTSKPKSNICDSLVSISAATCNGKNREVKLDYFQFSDDEDALSISDDGCIYTYKGDQDADLPISFFSLDMPIESPNLMNRRQSSSPEMDFLEMDFDPGPSGELDFESTSNNDTHIVKSQVIINSENIAKPTAETNTNNKSEVGDSAIITKTVDSVDVGSKKDVDTSVYQADSTSKHTSQGIQNQETHMKMPWTCSISDRTMSSSVSTLVRKYHCMTGELVSPSDNSQKNGIINNAVVCDNSCMECCNINNPANFETAMIWTEQEAYLKQVTQIGPSACGATSVLNVLNALKMPVPSIEKVNNCINTRLRANSSPLTEYLLSRSVAGTTHKDIINCLHKITDGQVYARFFHMYPERIVNLRSWLAFWINKGAVPIATLNLQKCTSDTVPDAWHHQMIFGVNSKGISLCNPIECVEPELLWPQLCSESVILVRREDVLSRWNVKMDLPELMNVKNYKWRSINVVGQVANLIFESRRELRLGFKNTSHIKIPASYSSGVTLVIPTNSSSFSLLKHCPELPILDPTKNSRPAANK